MKVIVSVVAAGVLAGAAAVIGPMGPIGPMGSPPASANPYAGMQEREEVFEFAQKPTAAKQGDKVVVAFASKGACDATVAIVGPDGKVVRHLASGVLGKNAPAPFQQNSLAQKVEWDGKDDDGKPAPAGCKVKVSLGLDAKFDKLETWALMAGIKPLAVGKDGELYAASCGLTGAIHVFGKDGKYVRTVFPPPAAQPDGGKITPEKFGGPITWNKTAKGDCVPRRNRFGGGYEFEITRIGGLWEKIRSGALTADGKLCLLSDKGAVLFQVDTRDGSCPPGTAAAPPKSAIKDKDGNVYVGGNGQIQVNKPDGSPLKTITGVPGWLLGVSQKTGAIYLWYHKSWQVSPIITKLGGLENPTKVAELTINGPWPGGQWRENAQSALFSAESDPPLIWFAGSAYAGPPFVAGIEDKGASLAITVDLLKANTLPNAGGDLTGPGMWASLHANRRTNEASWSPVGPDGLIYSRGMCYANNKQCVFKFKPGDSKGREYVSFPNGEECFAFDPMGGYSPLKQGGNPVIGPRMYHAQGSHLHQGPFCVAPNGDVYIGVTYSKETDAELEKAGLPRLQPKRLGNVSAPVLRVYGPDGKLKSPSALPGLAELEGLRVGRSGAVYVVQPWHPLGQALPEGLAAGSSYDGSRWAGLIKFAGNFEKFPVGRIEGAWEPTPASPTHEGAGMKVKIDGALWTYGGVSPHSANYSSCTCMKASADLDDYERSWVCAAQTCTVNVIDSNGNVMARLGGYGNIDDLRAGKKLAFGLPRNAAASDSAMWVVDIDYRALVKTTLVYRAEETVPVP